MSHRRVCPQPDEVGDDLGRTLEPSSLTHQHIAAALNTEQCRRRHGERIRVLDAGCGEGALIGFLHRALPAFSGRQGWQVHGFDVVDSTSHRPDFPQSAIGRLQQVDADVSWDKRVTASGVDDPWPYLDASFSYVVTNQVMEHVIDLDEFFAEIHRVLEPGGVCVNLFPLSTVLFEGHLLVPLAGQVDGHEQRVHWLETLYGRGIGKYSDPVDGADYIHFATHYRRWKDLVVLAKRSGLRISYRYTIDFYRQKARQLMGRSLLTACDPARSPLLDWAGFMTLRHVSSVTILLEKPQENSRFHHN